MTYQAHIGYQGEWGGDTTIDAISLDDAIIQAKTWAAGGVYDAGEEYRLTVSSSAGEELWTDIITTPATAS